MVFMIGFGFVPKGCKEYRIQLSGNIMKSKIYVTSQLKVKYCHESSENLCSVQNKFLSVLIIAIS
jgi:hypothetical protein